MYANVQVAILDFKYANVQVEFTIKSSYLANLLYSDVYVICLHVHVWVIDFKLYMHDGGATVHSHKEVRYLYTYHNIKYVQ